MQFIEKTQYKYSELYCVCKVRMIRQFYTVNKMTVKVSQHVNFHSKFIVDKILSAVKLLEFFFTKNSIIRNTCIFKTFL